MGFSFDPALPEGEMPCARAGPSVLSRARHGEVAFVYVLPCLIIPLSLRLLSPLLFAFNIWAPLKKQQPTSMFRIVTILLEGQEPVTKISLTLQLHSVINGAAF